MLPDGRRLGAHLPLAAGMIRAAERAHAIGATALQVFGDNPTAWKRRAELPAELPAFRERLAEHGVAPLVVHAAYLVNLAGHEKALVDRSVDVLAHELVQARAFGARFVNVHTGSHRDSSPEAGLAQLAAGVVRVLELATAGVAAGPADDAAGGASPAAAADGSAERPMLVLENSAGGGWAVGTTIAELADVAGRLGAAGVGPGDVGICLDTAHLWAAGTRIDSAAAVDALVAEVDRRLGVERLVLIHLNDSKSDPGSRLDRHEHLGAGRIGEAGLRRILTHPDLAHVTYILETPGMDSGYDAINVQRAFAIAEGRPLETLPPEAFEVRAGRSGAPRSAPEAPDGAGPAEPAPTRRTGRAAGG
jgi:deoxyribonuclease-4